MTALESIPGERSAAVPPVGGVMTALEAAKAIVGIGDRKRERDLRVFLIGQALSYVDRCLRYQGEKQPEACESWRNATWEDQDAAAKELLEVVIP